MRDTVRAGTLLVAEGTEAVKVSLAVHCTETEISISTHVNLCGFFSRTACNAQ